MLKDPEWIKWYLWHGNVFQALNELQSLEMDLDAAAFESKDENSHKLLKASRNYTRTSSGTRSSCRITGNVIATGKRSLPIVESAVNQVVSKRMMKKQQMGWSQPPIHVDAPGTAMTSVPALMLL